MSSAPNKDELLKMAVEAMNNGQNQPARMMLQQVLKIDGRDVRAMTHMAKLAKSPEERSKWLERILKIDPKNEAARQALHKINTRDEAGRNRLYFRIGAAVYAVVVLIGSIIYMLVSI